MVSEDSDGSELHDRGGIEAEAGAAVDTAVEAKAAPATAMNAEAGADESQAEALSKKKRVRWLVGGSVGLVAVVAVVGLALSGVFSGADVPEAKPEPTKTVERSPKPAPEPSPPETPAPENVEQPDPAVVVNEVIPMAYSPVWQPPDQGEAFWQIVDDSYGYPADGGTDFILAHACENRSCAGDQLRSLEAGDTLTYQGELYRIDSKWSIMKDEIAAQDIWVHDPNRLVFITCIIETTWELSDKNDILVATRVA